jgi:NAD(P)H-hydrate epimerase
MKMGALSRQQVRSIDQRAISEYGMNGLVLMENAGRGASEVIRQLVPHDKYLILCGLGNNAGDGFVIARHLDLMCPGSTISDIPTEQLPSRMSADARSNFEILLKSNWGIKFYHQITLDALQRAIEAARVIVDALVGTGASGPLRSPMDKVVQAANSASAMRIAIDVPSGLDCDTGVASNPCFCADHTITFVASKIGFELQDAPKYVGKLAIVDIGVPRALLESVATG